MGEPGGPRRGGQRGCACARGCERCPRCCRVSRHAAPTRLSSLRPRVHRYVLQSYRWRGSLCPPRQGRERPDVCGDTVRERGGWGGASFAGRVSVVFVIVVSIYNLYSRSSITAITVPPPPSPARLQTVPEKRSVPWWRGGVYSGGRGGCAPFVSRPDVRLSLCFCPHQGTANEMLFFSCI